MKLVRIHVLSQRHTIRNERCVVISTVVNAVSNFNAMQWKML